MPGSDCSDFFTDEQGYKCFACICLYISKDWAFRLLTRPDCSRSQAWLEVNFDAQEHYLEDWLCHLKELTEANFGTLARSVISNRKSFEASKASLSTFLQLERRIRERGHRRMEKRRKRDIQRLDISLKAQLRRERATRRDKIRKLKDKYRQGLRRLKRSHALR